MGKFHLFVGGIEDEPTGGMCDYKGVLDTLEEAQSAADYWGGSWAHIAESEDDQLTMTWVRLDDGMWKFVGGTPIRIMWNGITISEDKP